MYYRSTRNSRIERVWVEVGTQFVCHWWGFFSQCERLHCLNPGDSSHLWLIQRLFLREINDDCEDFQCEWNLHPISRPTTNNKSPQDLWLISNVRQNGQTGAGHCPDEEPEADDEEIATNEHNGILRRVGADLQEQVCHEAVEVPGKGLPFACVKDEAEFWSVLDRVVIEDITPAGYGDDHGTEGDESTEEHIAIGRQGTRFVTVSLAEPIWARRAKTWCQALAVLTLFNADGYF
ncbi:hypothetical protein BKA82DRAFT_814196 [Pisolithus tinctorius]|nr:hypothetical protein BKA82DRAFT_814196 [Pisolithus tinctorius]